MNNKNVTIFFINDGIIKGSMVRKKETFEHLNDSYQCWNLSN